VEAVSLGYPENW
jgi:hypothetical protein